MATEFRPLNEAEIHALDRALEKGELSPHFFSQNLDAAVQVSYERLSGGFCVCILAYRKPQGRGKPASVVLFRGASRQSKHDKPNRIKGDMLAFNRAIRDSRGVVIS